MVKSVNTKKKGVMEGYIMNKWIITLLAVLVILVAIFMGVQMVSQQKTRLAENEAQVQNQTQLSDKVTDECVDEWEEMDEEQKMAALETNSEQEIKLSPNCSFIFQKHFAKCDHISKEYTNIPTALVNQTKEEVAAHYPDWKIDKWSANEVIFSKEQAGECGEHYRLKDVDGKIVVYQIQEDGEEQEYEKTEIATDYLTETDKIHLSNGWKVNGKEELNQAIEDFE